MWAGFGQKIRKNEWNPANGPIAPSVREMLDYASARKVKLLAYVYPVLAFSQNPAWLTTRGGPLGGPALTQMPEIERAGKTQAADYEPK